jgi:Fe-S oxidoreductase
MSIEDFRADAMRCSRCAYCKWVPLDLMKSWRFSKGCPSVEYGNFHAYSAGGRLITALSLMNGRSTVTEKVRDSVFMCNMCGSCDVACKICRYDMEPLQAMRALRVKLVSEGHMPKALEPVMESLRRDYNMLGEPKEKRGDWAAKLGVKDLSKDKAKFVLHVGCRYSFDGEQSHVARAAVAILKKLGIDFGIMGAAESCCGGRAYMIGADRILEQGAEHNLAKWQKAGVETVVTPCADCYYAFKRLYPEHGSNIRVLHMVELLDRMLADGKLKLRHKVPLTVTYHDPCHLGRQGEDYVAWNGKEKKIFGQAVCYDPPRPRYNGAFGVYDAPRNILNAIPGVKLVEMERIKEAAWCCGAGGGCREEAESTGAEALVTACPWCEKNFTDSVRHTGRKLKVFDVLELVEQAL